VVDDICGNWDYRQQGPGTLQLDGGETTFLKRGERPNGEGGGGAGHEDQVRGPHRRGLPSGWLWQRGAGLRRASAGLPTKTQREGSS